jgi:hypothetical protein
MRDRTARISLQVENGIFVLNFSRVRGLQKILVGFLPKKKKRQRQQLKYMFS